MKKFKAGWLFACGALCGVAIALCVGAGVKTNASPKTAAADPQQPEWARLKLVGYPNGGTGFFDTETGIIYVYDSDLRTCYLIRRLRALGDPMLPVN